MQRIKFSDAEDKILRWGEMCSIEPHFPTNECMHTGKHVHMPNSMKTKVLLHAHTLQ